MSRLRASLGVLPDDLYIEPEPWPRIGRPPKHDVKAWTMLESSGRQVITPQMVRKFAETARERLRIEGGGYRRDHLRALAQRVEVADGEVRIIGSKGDLLRTLAAAAGAKPATPGVRRSVLKWRTGWDSNPRWARTHGGFQDRCLKPLGHPSLVGAYSRACCRAERRGWRPRRGDCTAH